MQVLPKYDVLKYDQIADLKQTQEFWHAGVKVRVWQGVVEGAHFCSSRCQLCGYDGLPDGPQLVV